MMRRSLMVALGLWFASMAVVPAWAADVPSLPKGSAWVAIVIALVMVLAAAVVSVMNPKRGHRD